jgi:hypothetical protein
MPMRRWFALTSFDIALLSGEEEIRRSVERVQ